MNNSFFVCFLRPKAGEHAELLVWWRWNLYGLFGKVIWQQLSRIIKFPHPLTQQSHSWEFILRQLLKRQQKPCVRKYSLRSCL